MCLPKRMAFQAEGRDMNQGVWVWCGLLSPSVLHTAVGELSKRPVFCLFLLPCWRRELLGSQGCSLLPFTGCWLTPCALYSLPLKYFRCPSWSGIFFYNIVILSYAFPSYSCFGPTLAHPLEFSWEYILSAKPWFLPVWARWAASVWPQDICLLLW